MGMKGNASQTVAPISPVKATMKPELTTLGNAGELLTPQKQTQQKAEFQAVPMEVCGGGGGDLRSRTVDVLRKVGEGKDEGVQWSELVDLLSQQWHRMLRMFS